MLKAAFLAGLILLSGSAAQAQAPGRYVEANGLRMHYEVSGAGEPLVVLHGAYMDNRSMQPIITALSQSNTVYALELQGHGRTADRSDPISYEGLADDVAAFMTAVGLQKAHVFGYSMGAAAGLQLVIRHPQRVNRAALASVAYDSKGWHPDYKAFIPQIKPELFVGTPFEATYREVAANPDGFPALVDKLIALEHRPMAWEADLGAIRTPVLIIQGDADIIAHEHTLAMFTRMGGGVMGDNGAPLPSTRLAILPGTSHTAVGSQPELLAALIGPFLAGKTPRGMFDPAE